MNASVRREGSGVCLAHLLSIARRGPGPFRRRTLGRAVMTGVAIAAPLVAAAVEPPSAPLPPLLPVAEKPAAGGLFAAPAKPAQTPSATPSTESARTGGQPTEPRTGAAATTPKPAANPLTAWNPAQSFAALFPARNAAAAPARTATATTPSPRSATPTSAATPSSSMAGSATPSPSVSPSGAASTVAPQGVVVASATARSGRFDPELGPAGLVVSDAAAPAATGRPTPADDSAFLDQGTVFPATPEPSAAAAEPVSLVSWLSKSYADYVASAGPGDPAGIGPAVCVTDRCCPTWQIQTDALFLWQGNIPSRSLYIDSETQQTVLDANQLQNRAAIAPRYAIIYNRDDCRAIEVNYFQVYGFNATASVGNPTDPALDGTGVGAFTIDNMLGLSYNSIGYATAQSSAHIKSFEVNLRQRPTDGLVQWISGFRWLEWGQGLYIQDLAYAYDSDTKATYLAGSDAISVTTLNSLYGWQWGGDMTLWNAGRWVRINGVGKAGVYYNHQASQNTAYSINTGPAETYADSKDVVSFVGETGLNASVSLTSWLSWRAGYSFFWLNGMAVPARQLAVTDIPNQTTSVNANGSVLVHGATTGLEARW